VRLNLPVTNIERHLKHGEYIVSKTDLKGRIAYVNGPFMEISGFSEEELLGQSHNIVRHPDMPSEAYADLWNTLRSGKPWQGIVKNRCKNGDHYWVEANANPIWENGRIIGYMSLRSKATRAQIETAERFYRQFRDGTARGVKIKGGAVVQKGLLGWITSLGNLSIKSRMLIACALLVAIIFGLTFEAERNIRIGLVGTGLMITVFIWWMLVYKILRPLNEAVRDCQMVASGDLRLQAVDNWHNEIGHLSHAIYTMSGNVASIVSDVRNNAIVLSTSSAQVEATAHSLSQATSEQAASVEETSSSVEQMSASINENSENAKVTDRIAAKAASQAMEGGDAVKQTVAAMKQIAGKISIVDDIAYQTNLLALNAAIEAARAGEYGKGFAVVAAEVRKLAERSQLAAHEIGELAGNSVSQAELTGKLLDSMVPAINKTSELVQQIATSSQEQSEGVSQVNTTMNQLSMITQQNAASSEELAATAENMSEQAVRLQKMMAFFKQTTTAN